MKKMKTKCNQKPVFGTKEWAAKNENLIKGCSHDCLYCYAKSTAIRYGTTTISTWKDETPNKKKQPARYKKRDGITMFPTAHDITPANLDYCMTFLANILSPGNQVLIVSKPHIECIKSICDAFLQYQEQILFRFTIGSTDNQILKFWEPGAPDFDERFECLEYAFWAGFKTSISCEPMLDNRIGKVVDAVMPYVNDAVWLGIGNDLISRCRMNGHGDTEIIQRVHDLIASQPDDYIRGLYNRYKDDPQIKWKESIKKIVGIDIPTVSGLDI